MLDAVMCCEIFQRICQVRHFNWCASDRFVVATERPPLYLSSVKHETSVIGRENVAGQLTDCTVDPQRL